jgi:hypothetical protein
MSALILLMVVLLAAHHWLMEPLLLWGEAVLELRWLGWLAMAVVAWVLAGRSEGRDR